MPVVVPPGLPDSFHSARVIAVVPARYQSTRLPGKPLALIGDRPMIEHVVQRARDARRVDAVLVATDDERIAAAVDGFGGTAVLTRPDHATGTDRLAEVAAELRRCELVVNVQGDLPLISPDLIDATVRLLDDRPDLSMTTLRRQITAGSDLTNPAVVKVAVNRRGDALYFSRALIPFTRPGQPQPPIWKHLGLYVYRREFLLQIAALPPTPLELAESLEQLRVLEHGFAIGTAEAEDDTIEVDTPEDLERVRRLMETGARL